jgi:hypothetical protein
MPHYEQNNYVQEHVADEAVWANAGVSWRVHFDAQGRLAAFVWPARCKAR